MARFEKTTEYGTGTTGAQGVLEASENITLTVGNIRNKYIRVRQFNGLITPDVVDRSGEIVLDLDGIGEIKTHINKEKGILAEGGRFGRCLRWVCEGAGWIQRRGAKWFGVMRAQEW